MRQIFGRERSKFEHWIEQHHRALFRHALWMTSRREVAEDCVQEAYYQAWKSRHTLKDESRVFSWLLTILRRTIYREYDQRAASNNVPLQDFEEAIAQETDKDHGDVLDLARAMKALSSAHRDILLLFGLHGLTYQEIGDVLEVPVGTVMSRLSRARRALDGVLNPDSVAESDAQVFTLNKGPRKNER